METRKHTLGNSEGSEVIYMERYSYDTLDDGLIAHIVKNLDREVTRRGGMPKDIDEIDDLDNIEVPAKTVDLLVEATVDLNTRTMRFTFASKLSYDVVYSFKHLDVDMVLKLLLSSTLLHFGSTTTIMEQLKHGGFNMALVFSEAKDTVYSRRHAIRQ